MPGLPPTGRLVAMPNHRWLLRKHVPSRVECLRIDRTAKHVDAVAIAIGRAGRNGPRRGDTAARGDAKLVIDAPGDRVCWIGRVIHDRHPGPVRAAGNRHRDGYPASTLLTVSDRSGTSQ